MLSLTCKASIKAMIYLSSKTEAEKKPSVIEIAEFINENEHTVGKLLQKLVKKKIINSSKGPNGGFYITETQKNQQLINIIYAIDGNDVFEQCGLGLRKCNDTRPCPFHNDFKPVRELFRKVCIEKHISDLSENMVYSTFKC
ncbi:Rrf2 family transcriptional regulator [Ignavibacteria bacterium]|nr:Rrf2 family transcriptional regulator [Bacteroidota bacterium]MCZ2132071.1 Rrf2 family transcriptional regulator [Bacteroidota bacterium]